VGTDLTGPVNASFSYPTYGPGSTFYVYIDVINVTSLLGYQVGFTFNSTYLQVTNVTDTGYLTSAGGTLLASFGFADHGLSSVYNKTGDVYAVGEELSTGPYVTGSGALVKVGFKIASFSPPYTPPYPGGFVSMMHFNVTSGDNHELILTSSDGTDITPPLSQINHGFFKLAVTPRSPTASLTITPASVILGTPQTFNATASTPGWNGYANVPIDWYYFNFGDGHTLNQTSPVTTHTYTAIGAYIANVTVHAGITGTSSVAHTATVLPTPPLVTISPTSVTLDVGQSQNFTSSVSGGAWPYSYQWYLNGSPVSGATGFSWIFAPGSPGSYSVYVNVTDSIGQRAKSNIATVTVNSAPSVTISPSSATITLGQSQKFTSTVSGGTLPYSYRWYLNGSLVSGANSSSWTFKPLSVGIYEIYVKVTDAVNVVAQSGNAQLKVTPPPVIAVTISQSRSIIDVGQSVYFSSTVSGGKPPYTYQWYLSSIPVAGANYSTWTFVPSSAGTYQVFLKATDSTGLVGESNNATVTVNPALGALVSPTSVVLDIGKPWTFIANPFNGTSPYLSYQWYINGAPVINATGATWTYTPFVTGAWTVNVTVTDSAGVTCTSNTVFVMVSSAMNPTISPLSVVMDVGQSQLYVVSVSGGTGPYSYQWYQWFPSGSEPFAGANKTSFDFTASFVGLNLIYVEIKDSLGTKVDIGATATVNPLPSVSISPSSATIDVGQSQAFTSSASGGTLPYSYQWYLNGSLVSGANSSSWTFAPISPGTYEIYLETKDKLGTLAVSNTAVIIANSPPKIFVTPTSVALDVGESWTLRASTFNGTSPYSSFQWYLDGSPVPEANNSTWTYTPLLVGSQTIVVTATDSVGFESTSNTVIVTVNAAMNLTISPASATLDFGQSQTYTVRVSGGASPYSYQWYQWFSSGSKPFAGATSATFVFTPSTLGLNIIYVVITDSLGVKVDWGATANVNPPLVASISPKSVAMDIGMSQLFTSTVVNGTQPYKYQWYIDNVPGPTSSAWTYTSTVASVGNHTIYVSVTDAVNFVVHSNNATIIVNPPLKVNVSPTSATTDLGLSISFKSNITGGMTPYNYQWYVNGTLVGATGTMFTIIPTSVGKYVVSSVVIDAFGFTASNTASATINPDPTVTLSPTSISIQLGNNQTFTASVTGGTQPYYYQWYVNGVLRIQTTVATFTFSPSTISTYYKLFVTIIDTAGLNATSNTAIINGHDVAVNKVFPVDNASNNALKTIFAKGFPMGIRIGVADIGYYPETFKVTAYANSTAINSQNVTLASGGIASITIIGTANLAYGSYVISAYAWPVTGEVNLANNRLANSTTTIKVTIPGDVNGDGVVNILDVTIIALNWLKPVPPGPANADVNGDGVINILDVTQMSLNWLKKS
jgi:hypothetical protein